MNCDYESVTASATDAITAMVETPHNATICTAAEVNALAAYVFFRGSEQLGERRSVAMQKNGRPYCQHAVKVSGAISLRYGQLSQR